MILKNNLLSKCPSDICKEVAYKIYSFYLYKQIAKVLKNAYKNKQLYSLFDQ